MEKRNLIILIILMVLLLLSILLMGISLLLREPTFGQVSGYIAICSVIISLAGVIMIIRSYKRPKP